MTRKKAIEAALRQYDDDGSAEALADRAYEAGRIAGLREAAKLAKGEMGFGDVKILNYANALAKKARSK